MNEVQYLNEFYKKNFSRFSPGAGGQDEPVEANPYEASPLGSFEAENGLPHSVVLLGIENDFKIDPAIETKVRAIEDYIKFEITKEGMRNSEVSFKTVFERFAQRVGVPLEQLARTDRGVSILDLIFGEVALLNGFSSKTFLKAVTKLQAKEKVSRLRTELKIAIQSTK